jgi:Mg2+-importing ATPase
MLFVPTGAALVGAVLPYTGLAHLLGFTPLPTSFFLLLFGMVVIYLLLVELAKTRFYRAPHSRTPRISSTHAERLERRIRRRASRFIRFAAQEVATRGGSKAQGAPTTAVHDPSMDERVKQTQTGV